MYEIQKKSGLKPVRGRRAKYPFGQMIPGETFFIPSIRRRWEWERRIARVRAAASKYGRKHGIEFYTVRMTEGLYVGRKDK